MLAVERYDRTTQRTIAFKRRQHFVISASDGHTRLRDVRGVLHLGPQKCCDHVSRQKQRSDFPPGVLADFASEESAAVRTLPPNELRAQCIGRIVDRQRTAFARDDVLGLVETEGAYVRDAAQCSLFLAGHRAPCGVFGQRLVEIQGIQANIHEHRNAPSGTNALAVEMNVNDGKITSSPDGCPAIAQTFPVRRCVHASATPY